MAVKSIGPGWDVPVFRLAGLFREKAVAKRGSPPATAPYSRPENREAAGRFWV